MRFDLRLIGETADGRECVMEMTIYAGSQKQLMDRSQHASTEGPWYFTGTNEPVPENSHIVVKRVKQLKAKGRQ